MAADSTGSGRESEGARRSSEPTFADVMNSFSFDSGRSAKRRRKDRKRADEVEVAPSDGPYYGEVDDRGGAPVAVPPEPSVPPYAAEEPAAPPTPTP